MWESLHVTISIYIWFHLSPSQPFLSPLNQFALSIDSLCCPPFPDLPSTQSLSIWIVLLQIEASDDGYDTDTNRGISLLKKHVGWLWFHLRVLIQSKLRNLQRFVYVILVLSRDYLLFLNAICSMNPSVL